MELEELVIDLDVFVIEFEEMEDICIEIWE